MKKMRRLGAMLLALIMGVSIAACGGTTNESGDSTSVVSSDASSSAVAEASSSQPAAEKNNPYPDPSKPVKFSFFANCTWLPYDTLDGIVGKEVEKLTGVTFDFTKATDDEQFNLLIASGDLPDLIMASGKTKLSKLSSPEYCYSYNELIEKYAPDWQLPEVTKKLNASYSNDGKFYMLKNEFNTIDEIKACSNIGINFGQLHMRDDIYKAIGSPSVKNKDEFIALLKTVKEKYPDMIPLVLNMREYGGLAQLSGYNPGEPKDANGNFCWYLSDPLFKQHMKTVNELYREGFIKKENFAYDTDQKTFQSVYSGKAFMVTHYAGNDEQTFTANVQKAVPTASFVQVPLMEKWAFTYSVTGWASLFITKKCKDPETAIKFLRWAKEPRNQLTLMLGVEGTDWQDDGKGGATLLDRRIQSIKDGKKDGDYKELSFLLSASDFIRVYNDFYVSATDATKAIFQDAVKRTNWSNVLDLSYPNSETDENTISTKLGDLFTEYEGKLLSSKSEDDFNKLFDKMMAEAEKIGIAKLNTYLSATYKANCEKFGTK